MAWDLRNERPRFKTIGGSIEGKLKITALSGESFSWRLSHVLLMAVCALVAAVSVVRTMEPATAAPTGQPPDGTWMVEARAAFGSRYCSDRLVRLTNREGQLSGTVAFARGSVPIDNLVLLPNGSFSGATRGGLPGSKLGRFYKVTGKFSGDAVSVTLEGDGCPSRHGTAIRRATDG
jgi:hypothetical protein